MSNTENGIIEIIDKGIELELLLSDLYMAFSDYFKDDRDFWWRLSVEEKHHASFLESGKEVLIPFDKFPTEILPKSINELNHVCNQINKVICYCNDKSISREEAFNYAVYIEGSAGEAHYQSALEKDIDSDVLRVFHVLNEGDKNHKQRILAYMTEHGIKVNQDQQ
ncbi:MAG: hypothetical protein D6B28_00285 [Gammaproteobacteria bacterium]|nr:MAG: hypothetical protein D6B28_00285 [Gammaproteobacteria bacterium]